MFAKRGGQRYNSLVGARIDIALLFITVRNYNHRGCFRLTPDLAHFEFSLDLTLETSLFRHQIIYRSLRVSTSDKVKCFEEKL